MEQPEGEVIIIVIISVIITTHLKNFQIFSLLISQTPGDDLCFAASVTKGPWQKPPCFNSLPPARDSHLLLGTATRMGPGWARILPIIPDWFELEKDLKNHLIPTPQPWAATPPVIFPAVTLEAP